MSRLARLLSLALLAVGSLALAACGNKEDVVTVAETEGIYVDIGELKYQVQISRQLNPGDVEDRGYLTGLPEGVAPSPKETWFGVFLRVQNNTEEVLPTASEFEIVDTDERVYRPVPLDEATNIFAYRPTELGPRGLVPAEGSLPSSGPTQGSLLLFRLTVDSLANRPLEFRIVSPENRDEVGIVDLDV
jgi:hypothetical protein